MPIYEYVCDDGHETETRQSINDDPLETCPHDGCASSARRKITGGGGFLTGRSASSAGNGSGGGACGPSCCQTSGSSGFT